ALHAQDLAYDAASNRLWASVTLNNGEIENSLHSLSLRNERDSPPILMADAPGRLAASADGHFLYVASSNALSVRRWDLWNGGPASQFAVGGLLDMKVVPDAPSSLVVFYGPLFVYQNGIPQPRFVNVGCTA